MRPFRHLQTLLFLAACSLATAQDDPMQQIAKDLLNVTKHSIFSPAPVKAPHQWEYSRSAEIYPNDAGVYSLIAGEAVIHGESPKFSYDHDTIQGWSDKKDTLTWKLGPAIRSGSYEVYAHYKGHGNWIGNGFAVKVGTKRLSGKVEDTVGQFKGVKVGTVSLKKGETPTVELSATKLNPTSNLFELKALEITPQKSQHRWFDAVRSEWREDIPLYLRYGFKTPDTAPPAHLIKGGPKGYAVITTEAIKKNSKELSKFVEHKNSLGYNTFIVTEKDHGGGTGLDALENIRKWLRANYKQKEILYVLFIGNPHPAFGETPMAPINVDVREIKKKIAAGEKDVKMGRPSDIPYMDLDGPTLDLNGDHIFGGNGDYHETDGINTVWDVIVGRIPYYGEDSQWGKYTDVDAILRKTINYENATYAELLERYQFEVDGMTISGHLVEWGGFTYYTREQLYSGLLTLDHFSWQNNSFMDKFATGVLRSGGHASPTFIESGVTSGWLASRVPPKDTLNVVAEYGGCDCAQPEHPMNMVYMHLRKGAISSIGASRSIASVGGHGPLVRPNTFSNIRSTSFMTGQSIGQIHWTALAKNRRTPNGGAHLWNLYGDPSIVPYPQKLTPKRPVMVLPSHAIRHFHQAGATPSSAFHFEYDIHNTFDSEQAYEIKTEQDWISLKKPLDGTIPAGKKITLHTAFNSKAYQLAPGTHKAKIMIKVGTSITTRLIEFEVYTPKVDREYAFDKESKGALNPATMETKMVNLYGGERRSIFPYLVDRTLSLEIRPEGSISNNAAIVQGNEFKLNINSSDQTLQLSWGPHKFGDYDWNHRYYDINPDGSDTIKIQGKTSLIADQWNQITLVRDYTNKRIALYLNGKLEGHAELPRMLFDLYKAHIPKGINAYIDNVTTHLGAWSSPMVASNFKSGYPVAAPQPTMGQHGASRQVTLKWQMPQSHRSFEEPTYYVYMSPNREDVAAKRPEKRFIAGKTTEPEFKVRGNLKPNQKYFWKVYAMSPDRRTLKGGDVWEFTTGTKISEQILASTDFKPEHKWTRGNITGSGIAEFKNNGDTIIQELDKKKLGQGFYQLSLNLSTHENKRTKPMLLTILGDGKEVFTHTVELNSITTNDLTEFSDFFELRDSVQRYNKLEMKLSLPGNGGRCPYWVFMDKVELISNIDKSAIPNRPPTFLEKGITLPPLTVKDNSYSYEFAKIIADENKKTVRFSKVDGPSWVTVQSSGRIFSYYGAPAEARGEHRLIVEATDEQGLSSRATFTLEVK